MSSLGDKMSAASPSYSESSTGRKRSLARIAKVRSLSNSLSSLIDIGEPDLEGEEGQKAPSGFRQRPLALNPELNKVSPSNSVRPHVSFSKSGSCENLRADDFSGASVSSSPRRQVPNTNLSLLPNKLSVMKISGHSERKEITNYTCKEQLHGHVPCSDPDLIKVSPAKPKTLDNIINSSPSRNHKDGAKHTKVEKSSSLFSSPRLSRRSSLAPPKIHRSSSFTSQNRKKDKEKDNAKFTEAINQIHNLCVFPAHPQVFGEDSNAKKKQSVSCECIAALTVPEASSPSNTGSNNSIKNSSSTKTQPDESIIEPQMRVLPNKDRLLVKHQTKSCDASINVLKQSPCQGKSKETKVSPLAKTSDKIVEEQVLCPATPKSDSLTVERKGRPTSWCAGQAQTASSTDSYTSISLSSIERHYQEEDAVERIPTFLGMRSGSLDDLSMGGGLHTITPKDARQKNYLVGGLGCLLGATELDRHFPNRTITIFIATWNMNGKEPPSSLDDFLLPSNLDHLPDMYVIGTQESGGDRWEWEVGLQATIGPSHVLFHSAILGVLHLTVFIRRDLLWFCSVPEDASYSLRPGTAWKTKGCVAVGFQIFGTKLLFISSHLTAHEEKQKLRIQNFKSISHSLDLPRLLPIKKRHKDVTHRYDVTFWFGDLNFRLAAEKKQVMNVLHKEQKEEYSHLMQWDQLLQAQNSGEAFAEFKEGTIIFPPTFKYDPGTDHYDSSSKQRVPSYTDRILFRSGRGGISCLLYDYCPVFRTSDHKPVWGVFQCKIRPGKDDVPLAAGLFQREVYLEALKRRRRFIHLPTPRNCPVQ